MAFACFQNIFNMCLLALLSFVTFKNSLFTCSLTLLAFVCLNNLFYMCLLALLFVVSFKNSLSTFC